MPPCNVYGVKHIDAVPPATMPGTIAARYTTDAKYGFQTAPVKVLCDLLSLDRVNLLPLDRITWYPLIGSHAFP